MGNSSTRRASRKASAADSIPERAAGRANDVDTSFASLITKYGAKGSAAAAHELVCFYEYARESDALRAWAALAPAAAGTDEYARFRFFAGQLERRWTDDRYRFIIELLQELKDDLAWQSMDNHRQASALAATNSHAALSCLAPWPAGAQLAFTHDVGEESKALTFERWGMRADSKRPSRELVAFWVDWEHATDAELAAAIAFYRPGPGTSSGRHQEKSKGKRGHKTSNYIAWLRDLGIYRLSVYVGGSAAREAGKKLGIHRADDFRRCCSLTRQRMATDFGWIPAVWDKSKPSLVRPSKGRGVR